MARVFIAPAVLVSEPIGEMSFRPEECCRRTIIRTGAYRVRGSRDALPRTRRSSPGLPLRKTTQLMSRDDRFESSVRVSVTWRSASAFPPGAHPSGSPGNDRRPRSGRRKVSGAGPVTGLRRTSTWSIPTLVVSDLGLASMIHNKHPAAPRVYETLGLFFIIFGRRGMGRARRLTHWEIRRIPGSGSRWTDEPTPSLLTDSIGRRCGQICPLRSRLFEGSRRMKASRRRRSKGIPHVALIIETSTAYGRCDHPWRRRSTSAKRGPGPSTSSSVRSRTRRRRGWRAGTGMGSSPAPRPRGAPRGAPDRHPDG